MRLFVVLSVLTALVVSGCASAPGGGKAEGVYLKATVFSALPGWQVDDVGAALGPLQKSCALVLKKEDAAVFGAGGFAGTVSDWREACAGADAVASGDAQRYFERYFTPYEIHGASGRTGLFTGYYEPELRGAYKKQAPYLTPIYARPANLVTVNLGDFKPGLKGEAVVGRVEIDKNGARLVPYYKRAEIEKGKIEGEETIVWVDNPVDAFFLHIQGSGLVKMTDGKTLQIGYAAQNGQAYTAIGRTLVSTGALDKSNVSMQSIRAWLEAHPKEAPEIMNVNTSYVFFRKLEGGGAIGAQGVELTPERSLAVDSKKLPYGAPLWLDAENPDGGARLQRLMIAQDTGGAIAGAVRGDFFWGSGAAAADKAGRMKSKGEGFILLPKSVQVPEERTWHFWRGFFR